MRAMSSPLPSRPEIRTSWTKSATASRAAAWPTPRSTPRAAHFEWPAEKIGEYEVVVAATDDGYPPKTARQTVKIRITERPPDAPAAITVPKPSFDLAKFVFLTAITEAGGKRQAWISLRTKGELLKLFEGDEFQVGEVTVKISRIAEKTVELDAAVLEKRLLVTLGQNLAEGRDLTAAGT